MNEYINIALDFVLPYRDFLYGFGTCAALFLLAHLKFKIPKRHKKFISAPVPASGKYRVYRMKEGRYRFVHEVDTRKEAQEVIKQLKRNRKLS